MIQVQREDSTWKDVFDKTEMEVAIMASTRKKYTSAFQTPLMQPPLVQTFGHLGIGRAADMVLDGSNEPPTVMDQYTSRLIQNHKWPDSILQHGLHPLILPVET